MIWTRDQWGFFEIIVFSIFYEASSLMPISLKETNLVKNQYVLKVEF